MTQIFFEAQKEANAGIDWELSTGPFKYISAAECSSKFAKFMIRSENSREDTFDDGTIRADGEVDPTTKRTSDNL